MQHNEQPVSRGSSPVRAPTHQQQQQQQHYQQQQERQQHSGGCQDLNVPADVLEYAERYQHGGEGTVRPPTATPSVLQRQRCREQPVPEAAAQLAQHFVTGGEGISRPLSAPSSDRYAVLAHQQHNQQQHRSSCGSPPRSCRPSLRSSCELPATAGASTAASVDLPAYILASDSLWDALCG
ncbi:hypothetical protein OEZ85_007122 [Tetradesmus obliquus]|uniref:Uncharacterized protein n=1 Tax=Tetradesmus obliquus TaxID=3088 RepID=A0ABY8TWM9_TETOB|nr:hypothetical protein OEZ85_007122 [Tetradesmus obliquus]